MTTSSARVTVSPGGLRLDGRPWWPAGLNAYQLGTNYSVNRGCGAEVDLDAYFGALPPRSLTRFDAFQALATNKATGQLDFTALDAVFAAAERHGQLLVPVLVAQDGACEDEQYKTAEWFRGGWRQPGAQALSYEQWVGTAVRRWSGSAVVAAWDLIGEPEPARCSFAQCGSQPQQRCPPDAANVLRSFVDEVGALVRTSSDTLTTVGFAGGGQCGTQGDEYAAVAASPGIDILQYHDYSEGPNPLPGNEWDGLARRLEQARQVGKPLLVAEIGEHAGSCRSEAVRASDISARMTGQREAGSAGALVWAFVPDPRPQECTFDVGIADPIYAELRRLNTG
ncbi:beta-mannosidase [Aldersonia sp. NBC_00410]|uniref:beta-mannosidase n=1 Tax=Aldersonia sp. NBC_00410 TaxID=2975954 RepID=UPI00225B7B58|nr:beta-mannosidase [Aldersonia sp. NBC_00410]MCX5042044.1 beta-mannosidase [Aldersonia sp. NBC_00410]